MVIGVNKQLKLIESKLKETENHGLGVLANFNTHINEISAKVNNITDTFNMHLQLLDNKITAVESTMISKINTGLTRIAEFTSKKQHFLTETTTRLVEQSCNNLKEHTKLLTVRLANQANKLF